MTGFIAGSMRKKVFSPEFMEGNFKTEHERFFPDSKVPKSGYPDMGSGRFSEKLSYKEWYLFNNGQRIHYNYMEYVTCVLCWLLIGGVKYPWESIAFASIFAL